MTTLAMASVAMAAMAGPAVAAPVCDGRHDATAALNQALAAGGAVRLPRGTCLVSGSVFVPSGTRVTGAGIGVTVIRATPDPDFPVISVGHGSPNTGARNVDISALTIDGSADRIGRGHPNGLEVPYGSGNVRVHDLEVYGAGGNGISVGTSDVDVIATSAHDNFANGIYVIGKPNLQGPAPVRSSHVRVLNNRVTRNSLGGLPPARQTWDGIDVDPITGDCLVQGNIVTGNDIILFENGKRVASSGGHGVIDNQIIDSPENGIDVAGPIVDFKVIGNRILRATGWGIVVNGPGGRGVIRGNTIQGTTREGIMIHNATSLPGAPHDIVVSGNIVAPGPDGRAAVAVGPGASDIRVTGNRLAVRPGMAPLDTRAAGPGLVVQGNQ